MDIKEIIIDQPLWALLVAVPVMLVAVLIKVGVVLLTDRSEPADAAARHDAAPPADGPPGSAP